MGERQAEEIVNLAGEDDDRDAGGEADGHRIGNEFDIGAEPQIAGRHQEHARHDGGEQHAVDAVALDGGGDEHDEGARRAADLKPAAAQERDQEAADDGGVEAAIRRDTRADGDRHRQRQGDDGDGETGENVGAQTCQGHSARAAR